MSFTATATREAPPTSINLNVFSHPPVKRELLKNTTLESHLMPVITFLKPDTQPTQHSDDEDIFNLDMVTMDMNFEQAYSMYSQFQQKNAVLEVERLLKAQLANHNRHHHPRAAGSTRGHGGLDEGIFSHRVPYQSTAATEWCLTPRNYPDEISNSSEARLFASPAKYETHLPPSHLSLSPGVDNVSPRHMSLPALSTGPLISPPGEMSEGVDADCQHEKSFSPTTDEAHDDAEDQFFSTTESSALDKFLDQLAFSSEVNPLEYYNHSLPKTPHFFDMQTMSPMESTTISESVKAEIANAFKPQETQDLKSFAPKETVNTQLRTPESVSRISLKRDREDSVSSATSAKKRKLTKPLLSLTQKRLNHSHLEQKRRVLCKEAYERCLRLVTDVDDYKNELVSAGNSKSRKKSKRKQINKEGLPNLSKHSALLKISNEIIKIRSKNEELKTLLGQI